MDVNSSSSRPRSPWTLPPIPAASELYAEARATFCIHDDALDDEFCGSYISSRLEPLTARSRRTPQASRHRQRSAFGTSSTESTSECASTVSSDAVEDERASGENDTEDLISGFGLRLVVELRYSSLYYAAWATAHGKYGVRGLHPRDDLALWGILRSLGLESKGGPLGPASVDEFEHQMRQARFLPGVSELARRAALGLALGQYLVNVVINFRNPGSYSMYIRQLCSLVETMYRRLRSISMYAEAPDELDVIMALFPDSLCKCAGLRIPVRERWVYVEESYVRALDDALNVLYNAFCECRECCERRGSFVRNTPGAWSASARWDRCRSGSESSDSTRFERRYVSLEKHWRLGALRLPPIRHLTKADQDKICESLTGNLLRWLLFCETPDLDLYPRSLSGGPTTCIRRYAIEAGANIALAHLALSATHAVARSEFARGVELMTAHTRAIAEACENRAREIRDPESLNLAAGWRRRAEEFRDLSFGNGRSAGQFLTALGHYQALINRLPDYRRLPERRARMTLLDHYYGIRRFPDDNVPDLAAAFATGERWLSYYLYRGDDQPQGPGFFRALSCLVWGKGFAGMGRVGDGFVRVEEIPRAAGPVRRWRCVRSPEGLYVRSGSNGT